jgi:hydroxyacylglutathione hydrolase
MLVYLGDCILLCAVGLQMDLKMFAVGSLSTNCYVIWCKRTMDAVVIDPGFESYDDAAQVLGIVKEKKLKVKSIIDTHGHPDHTCGNGMVRDATSASILIHEADAGMLSEAGKKLVALFGFHVVSPPADSYLVEGDVVRFGDARLQVLHTPGHSPGSVCLLGEDCIFSGDTLFAGSVGRVDLPGGSGRELLRSLREKLGHLSDHLALYPGHGPRSTIGVEKRCNPFLQGDVDASLLW